MKNISQKGKFGFEKPKKEEINVNNTIKKQKCDNNDDDIKFIEEVEKIW